MQKDCQFKILLIETNTELRNSISSMLAQCGHTVTHTEDANLAASLISSSWYDAIIYSFNPGQVQLSAVVLNAKTHQPHLKLITTNEYESSFNGFCAQAIDVHLKKPFALADLQDLVCATVLPGRIAMPELLMTAMTK